MSEDSNAAAIITAIREEHLTGADNLLGDGSLVTAVTPADFTRQTIDLERFLDSPRRARGTTTVYDAAGFTAAVRQREVIPATVYGDEERMALVAVLNDDTGGEIGWRDYRVDLALRRTPEWNHWKANQGLGAQERFAETVEEGLAEIEEPEPATMLELAQTFHATTTSRFKKGARLQSGQVQVQYEEEVDAKAGTAGTILIPETFTLIVRPFFGAERFRVKAWLRFRLLAGKFEIGYKLDRPDEVERQAFVALRDAVGEELARTVIAGRPPASPELIPAP